MIRIVYNTIPVARNCVAWLPKQAVTWKKIYEINYIETIITIECESFITAFEDASDESSFCSSTRQTVYLNASEPFVLKSEAKIWTVLHVFLGAHLNVQLTWTYKTRPAM